MALVINSNIPSLNAQRNLLGSQKDLAKSLERLSSGMRINRAGDDAAGLAISESLLSQVRGLNMSVRNANDGISLINTAEGALQEVTNMFQRIRELSIQSANDTNSASNRRALQLEVDQLIEELGRITEEINFNGRNMFDGTFTDMKLHVGADKDQNIELTIRDMRAEVLGAAAVTTSSSPTLPISTAGDIIINGTELGTTVNDGESYRGGNYSAIAYANMINAETGATGVMAEVEPNEIRGATAITATSIAATDNLTINGVIVPSITVQASDADGTLVNTINSIQNLTGVEASVENGTLILTNDDGENIAIDTTNAALATALGLNLGPLVVGDSPITPKNPLAAGDLFTIDIGAGAQTIIAVADGDAIPDSIVANLAREFPDGEVVAHIDSDGVMTLEAQPGLTMTLAYGGTMQADLGLAAPTVGQGRTFTSTYTLTSDEIFNISGQTDPLTAAGLTAGPVAIDYSTAANMIDISTQEGANDAILACDYALRQITTNRAELGAKSNRLETTVRNLMTISENMAASNSQIRDADFAQETATMTKNQILQQAGVAVLAQANQIPQTALSLLQ